MTVARRMPRSGKGIPPGVPPFGILVTPTRRHTDFSNAYCSSLNNAKYYSPLFLA